MPVGCAESPTIPRANPPPLVYELVPLGDVFVVPCGVVATKSLKLKLISLITYCSGIFPKDSLTIILETFALSI